MADDGRAWDGDDRVVAQDADAHPSYLPQGYVAEIWNRQLRGGVNRTRPPFVEIDIQSSTFNLASDSVEWIQNGNYQGGTAYSAQAPDTVDGLTISVAGRTFFLSIASDKAYATEIHRGNQPKVFHNWFCQAEDQLYIQNDTDNPLVWDGIQTNACQILNPGASQMPIGNVMEYIHGRVFVCRGRNIFASDIIYGGGFTTTTATRFFTETNYWAEGGAFGVPTQLGEITGLKAMPSLGDDRGQGELVVLCQNGFHSINANIPRSEWNINQIQRMALIGRGNVSPWSITSVNNEIFFRSNDGWSMYRNSQNDFQNRLGFRKMSQEVNKWVDYDTLQFRQYASASFFDNRVLFTVSPFIDNPNDLTKYGSHRAHRAMGVLDLDQSTSAEPDSQIQFRYNGLWTGIRPIQIITGTFSGIERCFIFSYGHDRRNHLYELLLDGINDFSGGEDKKIESYTVSRRYHFEAVSNRFQLKQLYGGQFFLSDIPHQFCINVDWRGVADECWNSWLDACTCEDNCTPNQEDCSPLIPKLRDIRLNAPTPEAEECNGVRNPTYDFEFQLRIKLTGHVTLERYRIAATDWQNPADDLSVDCEPECVESYCCTEIPFDFYQLD